MSTGWLGRFKGRYVRRCLVRAMYLSASEVGLSYLGRYTKCSTFYLYLFAVKIKFSNPDPQTLKPGNFGKFSALENFGENSPIVW